MVGCGLSCTSCASVAGVQGAPGMMMGQGGAPGFGGPAAGEITSMQMSVAFVKRLGRL
jgi:hypothetical protein